MLCGSMFNAQLAYIVGLDQTENEVKRILCYIVHPLYCTTQAVCLTIAVLLHYLILVMCMWMLMEGVVLYVMLVKVFITLHKRYIAFFTIASYGR